MSNGSHAQPPNDDGDHEGSNPWLALIDTDAIEDVRDELRQIMARYNDALPGAQDVNAEVSRWQSLAQDDDNSAALLSDTSSVLTLNPSPASTNIAEQYERQDRDRDRGEARRHLHSAHSISRVNLNGLPSASHNLRTIDSLPYLLARPPIAGHLREIVNATDARSTHARPTVDRSPRHMGLMGRLNKVRLLGELVEVVESVQGEEEFCEQLHRRLMEFRRTGFCDMEPLIFGSDEQAELVGQPLERYHFAEAIAYLDQNMRLDRDLYQLAEDSLKRFKNQRAVMHTRASKAQNKFYDLLDQLVEREIENCSDMIIRVRSELHELSGARKCLRRVVNQMIIHPLSERTYSETMRMIKCLVGKLCVLMTFKKEAKHLIDLLTDQLLFLKVGLYRQGEEVFLDSSIEQERISGHLLELHVGNAKAPEEETSASDSGYDADRDLDSSSTTDQRSVQQSVGEKATRRHLNLCSIS